MRNSLKMDVLDELRLFREKRLSTSTFCAPVSYSNLNLKLESETVERIVFQPGISNRGPGLEFWSCNRLPLIACSVLISLLRRGLHEVSSEGKVSAQGVMGRAK